MLQDFKMDFVDVKSQEERYVGGVGYVRISKVERRVRRRGRVYTVKVEMGTDRTGERVVVRKAVISGVYR